MADGDLTYEGKQHVTAWLDAQKRVGRAESELSAAQCDLRNTEQALGKWLLPGDAKPGEKIAVWFNDSLVQAEVPQMAGDEIKVTMRKRGKNLYRAVA